MKALIILGVAALCMLQLTSAHPRRYGGFGGGDRDGPTSGGDRRSPFGGLGWRRLRAPFIQACQLSDGGENAGAGAEAMECRIGECNGASLDVTIDDVTRQLVFCNHTRKVEGGKDEDEGTDEGTDAGTDAGTDEGTDEGVISERLRLAAGQKPSEEELMLKYVLRSACNVNGEEKRTKRPCDDCSLGPVVVSVNGTSYTALYCNKPSVNETTTTEWLKVFTAGCARRRRPGYDGARDDEDSSEEGDDDEEDEEDDAATPPAARRRTPFSGRGFGGRRRGRRSPRRGVKGACKILLAADNTTLESRPCKGKGRDASQCNVGPIDGVGPDGKAIQVFFCEKKESSEESDEEVEPMQGKLYKKLLKGACAVTNGSDVISTKACRDETLEECSGATFSFTDKSGNPIVATYCSPTAAAAAPDAEFSLLDAFSRGKGGKKNGHSSESDSESDSDETVEEGEDTTTISPPAAPERQQGRQAASRRRYRYRNRN